MSQTEPALEGKNLVIFEQSTIRKALTPLEKFMYGLKSADTRRQYPKLLLKFLDFLNLRGTLELKATQLYELGKNNSDTIENELTRFVIEQKERVVLKQIAAGTLRNYVKAVRLFCKMNKIPVSWELLAKGLPPVRQYAEDRIPTIEEIKKLISFPDRRIKPIVLTTLSSGIRIGAWDYLKWKHIVPIEKAGQVVAAKITVYGEEPDSYYSFITPEAYYSLLEFMDFRCSFGEEITGESWVMRDTWQKTNVRYGHRIGLAKYPKQFRSTGIKSLVGRALQIQGIREPLKKEQGQKNHEWKTMHGLRKMYKTRAEQVMKPVNVEVTMGHNIGISASYYKPSEKELLADYLKAVRLLSINNTEKELVRQVEELHERSKDNEFIISRRLEERDKQIGELINKQEHLEKLIHSMIDSGLLKPRANNV